MASLLELVEREVEKLEGVRISGYLERGLRVTDRAGVVYHVYVREAAGGKPRIEVYANLSRLYIPPRLWNRVEDLLDRYFGIYPIRQEDAIRGVLRYLGMGSDVVVVPLTDSAIEYVARSLARLLAPRTNMDPERLYDRILDYLKAFRSLVIEYVEREYPETKLYDMSKLEEFIRRRLERKEKVVEELEPIKI